MKRLIASVLASASLLSLLAGCSGGVAPTATGESAGDGPVTIEFWHSMGSTTGELLQEIVDEFNASQDDVYVEAIYQGDYTTAGTKLQAAVSGGNAPQVAQIEITSVGMYANAGMLLDLMPYAENDPDFDLDSFYDGVMDFSYYDGQLISLPNGRSVPVLYYNADAFQAAGLDAPETWDDLRNDAKALTKDGTYGFGLPLGDSWYYLAMVLTAGGQIYNAEGNNIGFHDESGTKPLQLWLDMMNEGTLYLPEGEDYASNAALRNAFMAGTCAMTMQSSAQYRSLADNSDFEVGVAYIPKDVTYAAIPGGSNLVAFAGMTQEEEEATWQFMKYMCSGEVAGKYAAGTGYLPTSEAALNSAEYQEMLAQYPYLDVAVDQLEYFVTMPFDEAYTEIKDQVIGKYEQECIIGGMSPEDAVENMYQETAKFYE